MKNCQPGNFTCSTCGKEFSTSFRLFKKHKCNCNKAHKVKQVEYNHKVISIKIIQVEPTPVYDITVDEYHNFALTAGVFVHNCLVPVGGSTNDMYEDAGSIYGELIQLADYFKCFIGDTKILLTNGTEKRMDELISGEELSVYSCNNTVEKAIALGVIDYTDVLYGIRLNNGSIVKCTPDHKFMMRDGTYKKAQNLCAEDKLMSLSKKMKVKSVIKFRLTKKKPVYCINVPRTGNFALASGIIVGNCPVVTFAQPRRDAWEKAENEVIMSHDLAHSAKKAHKAYSITSINFKKGAQRGKLYIDKCRRGEDGVFIDMERDLTRSYFGERDKNTYYDDQPPPVKDKDEKDVK
jgi:hypothetical protein